MLLLLINVLEDLQLTFFSWRPDLFSDASGYRNVQYVFNPVYYLVKNYTTYIYIASFVVFIVLAAVMGYCTSYVLLFV